LHRLRSPCHLRELLEFSRRRPDASGCDGSHCRVARRPLSPDLAKRETILYEDRIASVNLFGRPKASIALEEAHVRSGFSGRFGAQYFVSDGRTTIVASEAVLTHWRELKAALASRVEDSPP